MRDGRQIWRGHRAFREAPSVRRPRAVEEATEEDEEAEEEEMPSLNVWSALILLVAVTVLVAFTAEFLVSSINGLTEAHPEITTEWVALILLPIVGNAAEHVTAVSVSVHDKLDLSLGVAVGSSIQIALFVIPLLVVLGWIMDKVRLSLYWNQANRAHPVVTFETASFVALRPLRVDHPLPLRAYGKLYDARREVQLA